MTDATPDEMIEDASIEGLPRRSRFGGFVRGALLGTVVSGGVALGLSLMSSLPPHLPGVGRVEVVRSPSSDAPDPPSTEQVAPDDAQTATVVQPSVAVSPEEPTEQPETEPAAELQAEPTPESDGSAVETVEPAEETGAPSEPEVTDTGTVATGTSEQTGTDEPATDAGEPTTEPAATEPDEDAASAPEDADTAEVAATSEAEQPAAEAPAAEAETEAETTETAGQGLATATQVTPKPEETRKLALSGPAFEVNARPFQTPAGAPLLAVVLEDAATGSIKPEALALMTMPLTFAVRADSQDARAFGMAAREAGHEVLAELPMLREDGAVPKLGELSPNAAPDELEALTQQHLASLDMAIGATAPDGAKLLLDRLAMAAVMAPVSEHGFAYLDLRAGIGSAAERIAGEAGVAYAASNRFVDAGATEEQIYQLLEGASFQARRKGTAIVTITASPEALKALVRWGLERGGQDVWFAPLSAVMKRQQSQ